MSSSMHKEVGQWRVPPAIDYERVNIQNTGTKQQFSTVSYKQDIELGNLKTDQDYEILNEHIIKSRSEVSKPRPNPEYERLKLNTGYNNPYTTLAETSISEVSNTSNPRSHSEYEELKLKNDANNHYTKLGDTSRLAPVYQNMQSISAGGPGHKYIVCIDIGSKYSGYAFSPTDDRSDVTINKSWGASRGMTSYKTPSIVTSTVNKTRLIGFEAFDSFQNDEVSGLLWNFKKNIMLSEKTRVRKRGQKAFCVMAEGFVNHALNAIKMKYNSPTISMEDVLWKFSVPSYWSSTVRRRIEKQLKHVFPNGQNIVLQRETDLVALYCMSMDLCMSNVLFIHIGAMSSYFIGYNINDIGVEEKFRRGVGQGGEIVNDGFMALLQRILTMEFMMKCKKEYPAALAQILFDFETAKQGYTGDHCRAVSMTIPYSFAESYQTITNCSLKETLNNYTEEDGQKVMRINKLGKLEISGKTMGKLYEYLRNGIYQQLRFIEAYYSGFKPGLVYLTGGVAECKIIQNLIKNIYNKVIIPENANLCAMKGGLCYPHPYFREAELSIKIKLKQHDCYIGQEMVLFHKGDLRCLKYNWRPCGVNRYDTDVTEVITCDITGSHEIEVRSDADVGSFRRLKIDLYQIQEQKDLMESFT